MSTLSRLSGHCLGVRLPRSGSAVAILLALVVGVAGVAGRARGESTLRVLSYNIHHGRGTDGVIDLPRLAAVIDGCAADIVLLQEVDDRTDRSGRVDQAAELARLTGLEAEFGRQIDYMGGGYGQAILSRTPLAEPRVHVLPGAPDRETRIAFSARTQVAGHAIVVVGTHLHHRDEPTRVEQARAVEQLDFGAGPAILGGDLNATPESEPLRVLLTSWHAAGGDPEPTFPAGRPTRQIDYILHRPAGILAVKEIDVLDEPVASDHRPILAVFTLR